MRELLRLRDARLYLAGQAFSLLGDLSLSLAMSVWVKTLTGSNGAAGLTFCAFLLPQLASPVAGLLVDRLPQRPLLIAVNLASALAVAPLVLVHDAGDVWIVYAVMAAPSRRRSSRSRPSRRSTSSPQSATRLAGASWLPTRSPRARRC